MIKDLIKNFKVASYVFKFCPMYIFYTILYIIATTVGVVDKVMLIEGVVKIVETSINEGVNPLDDFSNIISLLSTYIIIITIVMIVKSYYTYLKGKYRLIYMGRIQRMMYEKAGKVDYSDFDNPDFYDVYSRALRDGTFRGIVVFEDFSNFLSSVVSTIALGTYIVITDYFLIAVVIVSVITRMLIANKVNKINHNFDTETEIDRRMYGYVNRTFYQQRYAAELKTTPIGELLIDNCKEAQNSIDTKYIKKQKKNTILHSTSTVVSNLFENGGIYLYLAYKLFNGLLVSKLSSMLNAATQFSNNFYDAATFLNRIKVNSLYIDYFLDYMNYKPKLEDSSNLEINEEFEKLEFKNVTFQYPTTDFNALEDINLSFKKGDKIAIVGLNGAGKTTLIKLLLKFYNPTIGDIYYNNQTIRETKESSIRNKYSIIFQDYRMYGVSLGENVLMRKIKNEEDEKIIIDALEKVGLKEKIIALPEGINTIYTREFGNNGVVFSGGEAQKLAIARVFASNSDIYILDEPTSSLDPIAEHDINKLILEQSKDKTIIIIAHRLSTVVDCNRILLMEYGKIIEDGTHHELMKCKGRYYEMFTTQASLYVRENTHLRLIHNEKEEDE